MFLMVDIMSIVEMPSLQKQGWAISQQDRGLVGAHIFLLAAVMVDRLLLGLETVQAKPR